MIIGCAANWKVIYTRKTFIGQSTDALDDALHFKNDHIESSILVDTETGRQVPILFLSSQNMMIYFHFSLKFKA